MHASSFIGAGLALLCAGMLSLACGGGVPPGTASDGGIDAGPDAGHTLTGPTTLSGTGLYSDIAARTLAPGVIHFTPRFELWSDGAEKERYLLVPEGKQIDTSDMDNWVFPVGTKAWKQFSRDGQLVETRLLWKVEEGKAGWFEMAYVWNLEETDAFAAPDGMPNANGTPHDVPSQDGCGTCHAEVRDVLIGPGAIQLSRPGGNGPLTEWANAGLLSHPPQTEFEVPGDPVIQAALGYLHGNCAYCHQDGNPLATRRKLRLDVKTTDVRPEKTGVYRTTFDVKAFHSFEGTSLLVVPGDSDASQLFARIQVRDAENVNEPFGYQMPPTCTEEKDEAGIATIRAWIQQL